GRAGQGRWLLQHEAGEAVGAALAEELKRTYPELVNKLVSLFQRMQAHDQRVGEINITAPAGEMRRLSTVERAAGRLNAGSVANPPPIAAGKLPRFEEFFKLAWPPPPAAVRGAYREGVAARVPP